MLQTELRALDSMGRRQAITQCPGDSEDHAGTSEVSTPALPTPFLEQHQGEVPSALSPPLLPQAWGILHEPAGSHLWKAKTSFKYSLLF